MSQWQPTGLEEQRLAKLTQLSELGLEPYPLRVERTHTTAGAKDAFEQIEGQEESVEIETAVCGRLVSMRDMGRTARGVRGPRMQKGDRLIIEKALQVKAGRVPPRDYPAFRDFCQQVDRKDTEEIVIELP